MTKVLFVAEKWAECNPAHGLSNAHHNFIASFGATGLGTCESFFYDAHAWATRTPCDATLLATARRMQPEIVFLTLVRGTDLNPQLDTLARMRAETGARIVALWGDTYDDAGVAWIERHAEAIDLNVVQDCYSHYRRRVRDTARYLDAWTPQDPATFYAGTGPRDIDVSFVGSVERYPERKRALGLLEAAGIAVQRGGGQAEGGLAIADYAATLRRARIALNFARPVFDGAFDGPATFQCKGRTVEATLSGALLLEQANPETERWLTPGVHYVPFDDERDLVDKARHYLAREEERAAIAAAGTAHAERHLSADVYWRRVFDAVLPAKARA